METTDSPKHNLYSPGQIAVASFLGSPLAASWFWSRNYLRLGHARSATHCLIWGIAGTAALVTLAFFLPDHFPNQAIPIGYTIGLLQAAKHIHGPVIAQHLAAGGRLGSWWVVVGISLLCLIIVLAVAFGGAMLFPDDR